MVKTINFPFVIVDKVIDLYLGHLSLSGIVTVLTPVTPVFVSVIVCSGNIQKKYCLLRKYLKEILLLRKWFSSLDPDTPSFLQ